MRKFLHWVWSFLEVVIVMYVILVTAFILCRNKFGYTQFGDYTFTNVGVQDERNIENSKKGDLLIVRNSSDIKVGDLIYYYAVFDDSYIIKTNVVTNVEEDDYNALYTIDDSDGVAISSAKVLGKYATTYKTVGGILDVVESRIGFLFLVLLPIMIVFIYQIYEFIVIIRYERVEDNENDRKSSKKETTQKNSDKKKKVTERKEKSSKSLDDIEIL